MERFARESFFETTSTAYPGERLIACWNPATAQDSARTRRELLNATAQELAKIAKMVTSRRLLGNAEIGIRAGKVVNKFKVAKFFVFEIEDSRLQYQIDEAAVAKESELDGIYVIRTNVPAERLDAAECIRTYKRLARVERAFRTMKTVDLHVRPIRHRLEDRVRAHFFLVMLAYYVEWHMRQAWKALLFDDETPAQNPNQVARAERSMAGESKAGNQFLPDGTPIHSFHTLLQSLATIVKNTCQHPGSPPTATFQLPTAPSEEQQSALRLVEVIEM